MTYSRPKLNNNFFNININKKKKKRINSSKDHLINNILEKNNKINTLITEWEKNKSISNQKYSSTKRRHNKNNKELINKKNGNINNKNIIFSNNENKHKENLFKKELLFDEKISQFDELKRKENEKNNEGYDDMVDNDFSIIKSKNLVFNLKSETNNTYNFNNAPKINSLIQNNNYSNKNRNNFIKDDNKNSNNSYLIKKKESNQRMKSFDRMNMQINDDDLILKEFNNNLKKVNYSLDKRNKNNNHEKGNNTEFSKLLNMLNAKNITEAISKVAKLLKIKKLFDECKQIFNKDKNNIFINNQKKDEKGYNNFQWLSEMIKNYKENKIYKNFCESIMINHKIEHFVDFKKFVNKLLFNNKKNNGFLVGVKNILSIDDLNINNNRNNNINKNNYESPKYKIKKSNNKTFYEFENSNDIKFSRNDEDIKDNQDWIKTYY